MSDFFEQLREDNQHKEMEESMSMQNTKTAPMQNIAGIFQENTNKNEKARTETQNAEFSNRMSRIAEGNLKKENPKVDTRLVNATAEYANKYDKSMSDPK